MQVKFSKYLKVGIPAALLAIFLLVFGYPLYSLISVSRYPQWIRDKVFREALLPKSSPPTTITYCLYNNRTVYYIPPRYNGIAGYLYDESGSKICSPDGGDAAVPTCSDYFATRAKCKDIWQDVR